MTSNTNGERTEIFAFGGFDIGSNIVRVNFGCTFGMRSEILAFRYE